MPDYLESKNSIGKINVSCYGGKYLNDTNIGARKSDTSNGRPKLREACTASAEERANTTAVKRRKLRP